LGYRLAGGVLQSSKLAPTASGIGLCSTIYPSLAGTVTLAKRWQGFLFVALKIEFI